MFPRSSLSLTVLLILTVQILSTGDCRTGSQKQRHKREWVVPAKRFTENVDYSHLPYISKMRSDNDENVMLRYTLRGPGTNQPPVGTFIINAYTGFVRISRPLDREERQNYTLIGTAWYTNNTIAEDNVRINIIVEDQNDNPPVFIKPERSSVYEGSPVGTSVTQVVAKDADEPNTLHTKIAYSLIKQEPNDGKLYFAVDKDDGTITVSNPTLDREEHRAFVLTVQAGDMYGSEEGNSATTTVIIDILDVNDNIPTLEKDEYSASIDENEAPVEVLRIQALDNDEERTDNWLAEFKIISGNEDGRFSIETDPKTNMGILYLNKPVDFESASDMNLNLVVANKAFPGAPLGSGAGAGAGAAGAGGASGAGGGAGASGAGGGAGASGASGFLFFGGSSSVANQKSYPVKISVKNKPEGPKFKPKTKPISVSENAPQKFPRLIDTYTAIEEDTGKAAENVKYAKGYDPDNWISIDMDTAEIKLNKAPDRESPFVVNGTYYAKILCISDELHPQTSTGTIALQVEDLNDNCPKLLNNVQFVCSNTTVVNVTAEDRDSDPNGAPLEFTLIQEKTNGKWNLQRINDVSALLLAEDYLWPGFYEVTMEIRDKQGLACPDEQVLSLEVCTCSERTFCASKKAALRTTSSSFGASGVGLLILGFLCLILPLMTIIKCDCKNTVEKFIDIPFETEQHLISYSTEGKGDGNVPLMGISPKQNNEGGDEKKISKEPLKRVEVNSIIPENKFQVHRSNQAVYNGNISQMVGIMQKSAVGGFYYDMNMKNSGGRWQETCVSLDAALREHITQKYRYLLEEGSPMQGPTHYDYEGEGSVTGSIDSCSFFESDDDLEFLDNLGSKFNTLAKVCGFEQTDPKVVVNTGKTTLNTTASSSHVTNIQLSPGEIPVKSPIVQPAPNQGTAIQEHMYNGFNQSMPSNVLLSEDGLGQGLYIISGTSANNITGDSVLYSQIGPQSPVMITKGTEVNAAVVQNFSPIPNLVMMTQQQLDGIGSLRMVSVPVESVVSREGRVTLIDGSVNGGKVFVGSLGPSHLPMSPQLLYPVSSQEVSGSVHMSQTVVGGVAIAESSVNGSNVLIGRPGTPNLVRLPQVPTGQVKNSLLVNGPLQSVQNIVSGKGRLVSGPTILEGPSELPLAMTPGVLPQVANRQF
ncbi:desmoglein-2.1 [Garra rufa]|uniref:desmoglein-2.1 n=1 Tax=Garra rufa TaxID=137080 RepID=UPI003CCEE123